MPTTPAAVSAAREPSVIVGGQSWPVPMLALKQNRLLQPIFNRVADLVLNTGVHLHELTTENMNDLADIAFIALSRAHPSLTRDEFEDMPIGALELVGCLVIVMQQSGLFKMGASDAGEAKPEEAAA